MAKTLEELKRENAAAEEADSEVETETEVEAQSQEETETADESEETTESTDEVEAETEEVEPWMQSEEQTSEENESTSVPLAKHVSLRRRLKGELKDERLENDALRAEIEDLKSKIIPPGQPAVTTDQGVGPRPKLEDFDYDEDKYNAAVDDWHDKRVDAKLQKQTQQQVQTSQQQQVIQRLQVAVDSHYERAEQLIEKAGIAPDVYQAADATVRSMFETMRPGQGDLIADQVISTLGDGSEKVMYYLGRNKNALTALQAAMMDDPSGMKAMAQLGRISAEVTAPRKKQSTAPKPSAQIRGDEAVKGDGKSWHKKYKAAGDNIQDRINVKIAAKRAGVDVSNW